MLGPKERCPIPAHRGSITCCGRRAQPTRHAVANRKGEVQIGPGVYRLPDGRERRTKSAKERVKKGFLAAGMRCAACREPFDDFREVELSHITSCGMNGHKRDDSKHNLTLLHKSANRIQGSMPLDEYLKVWKPEHCKLEPTATTQPKGDL